MRKLAFKELVHNGSGVHKIAHNATERLCAWRAPQRNSGFLYRFGARSRRLCALLIAVSGTCAWSQSLDLSSLDKLAARAKEAHKVSLDKEQLEKLKRMNLADGGNDQDIKKLMTGLGSIQVRNFEFEKAGEYADTDLDAVRAQIAKMPNCTSIVDSKEKEEHSQIFLCGDEGGKGGGLAIISAEPKELSVVYIRGSVNFSDLGKLNGLMGIPGFSNGSSKGPKSDHNDH
jgi:hypothetical protein